MIHKEILADLARDCPCDNSGWCFLKELIPYIQMKDRRAVEIDV